MYKLNELDMRFPNGKAKCLTLSYDDGVDQDIRLIELMKKYNIAGTFNISSGNYSPEDRVFEKGRVHRPLNKAAALELYSSTPLVEVATHGYYHAMPAHIPSSRAMYEILEDRLSLERDFGKMVRGHAYPYGNYNDDTVEMLRMCGIVYGRTTLSTHSFRLPENWLLLHPTCHHKELAKNGLADRFVKETPDREPWLFYLWGHTFEFEQNNDWYVIEEFFEKVANREDVWYATNIEVYEYVNAFNSLIFSADASFVTNPTSTDVWAAIYKKEPVCIPAGKTVEIKC